MVMKIYDKVVRKQLATNSLGSLDCQKLKGLSFQNTVFFGSLDQFVVLVMKRFERRQV